MRSETTLQRLSLWLMGVSLAIVLAYYGLPEIVRRVTLAVERGRAEAAGIQLKRLGETSEAFRLVAKRVAPAVVNVSNLAVVRRASPRLGPFGRLDWDEQYGFWPRGQGSGFVIDPRGYVVTNLHVVQDADSVQVRFARGEEQRARIVGSDPRTDLAVLKVQGEGLVAAEFGDSDQIEVGDWVLAIGNPFGLEQSVTAGIVSAKGRSDLFDELAVQDFIQTDAAINPGNSGGPLVNLQGQVVGINSAISTRSGGYEGVGFAIPSKIARTVVERLIADGRVARGWLGIRGRGLAELPTGTAKPSDLRATAGVLVLGVFPRSPADRAGLRVGDLILSVSGRRVQDMRQLGTQVAIAPIGSQAELEIERHGESLAVEIVIEESAALTWLERSGVTVQDLSPALAAELSLPWESGVWISEVARGSSGYRAGLRPGQRVVSVEQRVVENVNDFFEAVQGADHSKGVVVGIETPHGSRRLIGLDQ